MGRAAAGAVWDAFLGDLRTAAWILAGSGAVVAAAAASLIKPVDIREPLRRVAGWVTTEPRSPALRLLRGLCFLAAGLSDLRRDAVLRLLLTLTGVFLIYEGVSAILRLVYRAAGPGRAAPAARFPPRASPPATCHRAVDRGRAHRGTDRHLRRLGRYHDRGSADGPCDGHGELCDRPLDEVVLPATHNSMSVPLPGWYSSEQERPIATSSRTASAAC